MKNNAFTEEYKAFKIYEAEYDAAGDEAGKEVARKKVQALYEEIEAKGESYGRIFLLYKEAQMRGNEFIDLRENIWDRDVKALIDAFREYRIGFFTYSSGWTNTVDTAWLFLQNGCKLEGMVELYGDPKISFTTGGLEYETVHG